MKVTITVDDCCRLPLRIIPILGRIKKSKGPVAPTPQYARFPLFGVKLMAFNLADDEKVTVSVAFTDAKGNPAPVDGVPQWLVDNAAVLALTPAADGLSCLVAAVGPLGPAVVSLTADADLGAGVTNIVGVLDVLVTGGTATTVTLTPGTPVKQ